MAWTSDLRIYPLGGAAAMGVPLYSARGLREDAEPIEEGGAFARATSSKLRFLGRTKFRLLRISFACRDQQIPPVFWWGEELTIECVMPVGHLTAGGSPLRTPRTTLNPGSPAPNDGDGTFVDGDWTFTRMKLDVMVVDPTRRSFVEWDADVNWTLVVEEIGGS